MRGIWRAAFTACLLACAGPVHGADLGPVWGWQEEDRVAELEPVSVKQWPCNGLDDCLTQLAAAASNHKHGVVLAVHGRIPSALLVWNGRLDLDMFRIAGYRHSPSSACYLKIPQSTAMCRADLRAGHGGGGRVLLQPITAYAAKGLGWDSVALAGSPDAQGSGYTALLSLRTSRR
jgi:hypothetical protein